MPPFLQHLWDAFEKTGRAHGVDPVIFAGLYAFHYMVIWPLAPWILISYRRGRDVTNMILVWVFFLISPWLYPLFFGRNIPWYVYVLGVGFISFVAWHGYHKIQKKISAERVKVEAAPEPQAE